MAGVAEIVEHGSCRIPAENAVGPAWGSGDVFGGGCALAPDTVRSAGTGYAQAGTSAGEETTLLSFNF